MAFITKYLNINCPSELIAAINNDSAIASECIQIINTGTGSPPERLFEFVSPLSPTEETALDSLLATFTCSTASVDPTILLDETTPNVGDILVWDGARWISQQHIDNDKNITISSNDTTPAPLSNKLVAGTGISLVENNDGGNETFSIINTQPATDVGILQVIYGDIPPQSGTTEIPVDNSAPQITEGTELGSSPFTISADNHVVYINFTLSLSTSKNEEDIIISVFRDNTCIGAFPVSSIKEESTSTFTFSMIDAPGAAGTYTYSGRIGVARGTWYVNQIVSQQGWHTQSVDLGGKIANQFMLMEIHP